MEKNSNDPDAEDIVYGEDEKTAPNRMIVFDDLMTEAFGNKDNESTMNLITNYEVEPP